MHWLNRYGTDYHHWQRLANNTTTTSETWYRPIGIVESMFDTDGIDFEGRTDINTLLEAELSMTNGSISTEAPRRKILLAWTVLRFYHVILSARALSRREFGLGRGAGEEESDDDRFFVIRKPANMDEMVEESLRTMELVGDYYSNVNVEDFYMHVMNTSRAFDGSKNLARLFILPLELQGEGTFRFSVISVVAHEIADALSIFRWHAYFLDLLNMPTSALEAEATQLCSPSTDLQSRLPKAQEDLYPPISGRKARRRWFWAISRILRYVRRPPPPSFPNPLCRKVALEEAEKMAEVYPAVLDYSKAPPLNTYSTATTLSPFATSRLQSLCRSAGVSIGSGVFAFVGLVMMVLHEKREQPQQQMQLQTNSEPVSAAELPFTASFPLNPRPFLTIPTTGHESSLVLSFSDGLILPFLPSHLPLEGRFKLLARQAHKQLRVYQKRRKTTHQETELGSRSAAQMLPQLYLYTVDREERKLRALGRGRGSGWDVQGDYHASIGGSATGTGLGATCGVSSIGDRSGLIAPLSEKKPAIHGDKSHNEDGHAQGEGAIKTGGDEGSCTFDFRDIRCTVRAREGEFLVGCVGDQRGLSFNVSFDGCAIDPLRVRDEWKGLMEGLLEQIEGDGGGNEKKEEESLDERSHKGDADGSSSSGGPPTANL